MKGTILGLLTTLLLTGAVFGADGRALVEPQIAPGQARYIVVVERGAAQQASAAVTAVGGLVEADLGSRLVITMAPAMIDALRGMAGIRFIEKAALGSDDARPDRLEPLTMERRRMVVEPNSGQTWRTGDYAYDGSGNISGIGTAAAPGTQGYRTYTYDSVNRLTKAQISGVTPAATHEYGYDAYGNRTSYDLNGQPVTVPTVSETTNQLDDASYDSSGNQYSRGSTSATYDGFNMVTSYEFDGTNVETFVYTANDERIGVLKGTEWTWSLRAADGKVLRQYKSSSTNASAAWLWVEDFVHRNGMLLGSQRVAEEGGRRHYHLDHLGSARLVTSEAGSIVSEHDFLPFGEERTSIGQHQAKGYDREEPLRFTGHERDFDNTTPNDSSSYIDYMHARYYATTSGRFLSVDPKVSSAKISQPQTWNRYTYAINNPLNLVDPDGREPRAFLLVTGKRLDPLRHSAIYIRDDAPGSKLDSVYSHGGQASGVSPLKRYLGVYSPTHDPTTAYRLKISASEVNQLKSTLDSKYTITNGLHVPNEPYENVTNNCAQFACNAIVDSADMNLFQQGAAGYMNLVGAPYLTFQLLEFLTMTDLIDLEPVDLEPVDPEVDDKDGDDDDEAHNPGRQQ